MKKYSILCIFAMSGKTYKFKYVEMVCDNETILKFEYSAMSDGTGWDTYQIAEKVNTATFPKATICGWSVTS